MCGIAGHVAGAETGRDPRDATALVRAMTDALHHRGPDAWGVHRNGPAVLGTAAVDHPSSVDANQPMLSADGRVVLVFNGEIYNFRDPAAELRDAGVPLRTRSDTEVFLVSGQWPDISDYVLRQQMVVLMYGAGGVNGKLSGAVRADGEDDGSPAPTTRKALWQVQE